VFDPLSTSWCEVEVSLGIGRSDSLVETAAAISGWAWPPFSQLNMVFVNLFRCPRG